MLEQLQLDIKKKFLIWYTICQYWVFIFCLRSGELLSVNDCKKGGKNVTNEKRQWRQVRISISLRPEKTCDIQIEDVLRTCDWT